MVLILCAYIRLSCFPYPVFSVQRSPDQVCPSEAGRFTLSEN